jgi:hypothetical protein|tara:strand:+ start:864 stop:1028 length:165 start_codon:yes stop_codon:yes gene_type:complete
MLLSQRLQFKVSQKDEATIKREAEMLRMPLSTYLRLKVLDNEITKEKEAYTQTD